MKKKYYFFLFLFAIVMIELIGYLLIQIYSHHTDFIANRNYDKIREMLRGDKTVSKYWQVANLNYIPNPNFKKDLLSHNEYGFRGEKVSVKSQGKLRILCLGGSTTYGTGVNNNANTYPAQLKKILKDSLSIDAEVINAGVESSTSTEELSAYLYKYRYFNPDIVVLHSGGNDALAASSNQPFQLDYSDYRKLNYYLPKIENGKFWLHSNFLSFIIIHWAYQDKFANSKSMFNYDEPNEYTSKWSDEIPLDERERDLFYNNFYQNYKTLSELILKDSSLLIHLTFSYNSAFGFENKPDYFKYVDQNNELIRTIALQTNSSIIEADSTKIPIKFYIDDCHLNEDGEFLKARLVALKIHCLINNECQ